MFRFTMQAVRRMLSTRSVPHTLLTPSERSARVASVLWRAKNVKQLPDAVRVCLLIRVVNKTQQRERLLDIYNSAIEDGCCSEVYKGYAQDTDYYYSRKAPDEERTPTPADPIGDEPAQRLSQAAETERLQDIYRSAVCDGIVLGSESASDFRRS